MSLTPEAQKKLQKQVEFYFSDVNLHKDIFMKGKMAENPEGFVSMETLLTFNRVNSVTKEAKVLADAIRPSEKLVLSGDDLMVRRREPLPETIQTDPLTVYVKPLPPTATLEQLTEFFGKYGTVQAVWRRYFAGKKDAPPESRTKPSVFVVFGTSNEAEEFQKAPPEYEGVQLTAEMKTVYLERKAEEIAAKKSGSKKQSGEANVKRTPPMPLGSSYRVCGCGEMENFASVKSLWPAEEQKGVRYVFMPDKETALLIFQDAETGQKMVGDLQSRGTTLNGKQPEVRKLEDNEEKQLLENVEKEIADRVKQSANHRAGRNGGRGHKRSRD